MRKPQCPPWIWGWRSTVSSRVAEDGMVRDEHGLCRVDAGVAADGYALPEADVTQDRAAACSEQAQGVGDAAIEVLDDLVVVVQRDLRNRSSGGQVVILIQGEQVRAQQQS